QEIKFIKLTPELEKVIEHLALQIKHDNTVKAAYIDPETKDALIELYNNSTVHIKYQVMTRAIFQKLVDWWIEEVQKL
ncbi:hypothetical protein GTO27_07080, partial [Candidatus Bathyarchaeota archaeon]|nr:hypothetical protein [Candidatus Bathyarchaeota archaeon]